MTKLPKDLGGLAASFAASGVLHLVRPQFFETIVPRWLPERRGLVYASGLAELACAAALLASGVTRARAARDCAAAARTSRSTIRPVAPLPASVVQSTPSSDATRRARGLAAGAR